MTPASIMTVNSTLHGEVSSDAGTDFNPVAPDIVVLKK